MFNNDLRIENRKLLSKKYALLRSDWNESALWSFATDNDRESNRQTKPAFI